MTAPGGGMPTAAPRCYRCDKAILGGETIVGIDVSAQPGAVNMSPHCWACAVAARPAPSAAHGGAEERLAQDKDDALAFLSSLHAIYPHYQVSVAQVADTIVALYRAAQPPAAPQVAEVERLAEADLMDAAIVMADELERLFEHGRDAAVGDCKICQAVIKVKTAALRALPVATDEGAVVTPLKRLEAANEAVCSLRSDELYKSMLDIPGMSDALLELDGARKQARAALLAAKDPRDD